MQPYPEDMAMIADHLRVEQDQYELGKYKLQRLHQHEYLDSLQRKRETGEGYNRLVTSTLDDVGKEQGFENLPQEEIDERLFKVETERNGTQGLQAPPDDLPQLWSKRQFKVEFDKFSWGDDTNNDFSSIYAPNSVSYNDKPVVILDNQAQVHCTGNFNVLSDLNMGPDCIVLVAANGGLMETFMSGSVFLENFKLPNVHFCPDLGNRVIVSGSMLDDDDYGYEFRHGKFTVKDLKNDTTVGEGRLIDGNYILDFLTIARERTRGPEQSGLLSTVWNGVCSALHRLGLK